MTDHAPLTDDELMLRARDRLHKIHYSWARTAMSPDPDCYECATFAKRAVEQVLPELHAARAEVERLRDEVERLRAERVSSDG